VLGIGLQIMTFVLLVGVGSSILKNYYAQMSKSFGLDEMAAMLVIAVLLLVLVNKIPPMIAGIINGGGHGPIGSLGAGSVGSAVGMGAAGVGMAAAGVAVGGAAMAGAASHAAGGASALMAAFKSAQNAESGGGSLLSSAAGSFAGGGGEGGGGNGGGNGGGGGSPMDQAAGFDSSSPISFSGSGSSGSGASGSGASSASSGSGASGSSGSGESGVSSGGTAQSGSTGASSGSGGGTVQGGGSGSSGGSTLAKAGRIAAGTGANLARGAGAMIGDKVARTVEAAKASVASTPGGRLANEINNPGSLAQGRQDQKDIAAVDSLKEQQRGDDARTFLAEQANPTFENNSLTGSGSEPVDYESELSAFVNRDDTKTG
jgi:type IV secretion system protein TrbL